MQLLAAHMVLIASAIGLAALFGLRAVVLAARGGGPTYAALAVVSVLVAAALGAYLKSLRARWAALKASRAPRD